MSSPIIATRTGWHKSANLEGTKSSRPNDKTGYLSSQPLVKCSFQGRWPQQELLQHVVP
jgi:hypothetical protein